MRRHARSCMVLAITLMAGGVRVSEARPAEKPATRSSPARNEKKAALPEAEQETSPRQGSAGHVRMLEILREISENVDSLPNLGSLATRGLLEELAGLDDINPKSKRATLLLNIGMGEVRLGRIESGIARLKEARELVPKSARRAWNTITLGLGVSYLRLGETQNCSQMNSPDSCILPIRGGGVHSLEAGSKGALPYFVEVLANSPPTVMVHQIARWLLNIAHMTLGSYPDGVPQEYRIPPAAFESDTEFPRFMNVASRLGLGTFNLSGGALIDDLDNDGYLDLVVSSWDPTVQMRLFRNDRKGGFADATKEAGLLGLYGGLNLLQTDYDNDGNLDILVLRGAWLLEHGQMPNSLLRNNGDGSFVDVTFEAGLGESHHPTQTAAWADYDNDGDLDLFVGNEGTTKLDPEGNPISAKALGPCQLFRNNGDGTFTDVAPQAGVAYLGYPKGVVWGDYDGDRYPDLYISEYIGPNVLYHNNRDGTFTDVAAKLGVTEPLKSFPAWFWDFDNDGRLDLFVASYSGRVHHIGAHYAGIKTDYELPGHYRGDRRGGFQQLAKEHGLDAPMLPMGANFGDLNGDGFPDFYLGTGDPSFRSLMPNLMFLNQEGTGFADVTMSGGFGHLQKGHAIAFADLDNDGDDDVFEQMGGFYPEDKFADALYENPGFDTHWIAIQLVGTESNRAAIGARVRARVRENGLDRWVYRHVNSGGSFGANPLRQTLGLGKATTIDMLEVFWPTTNRTHVFRDVRVDQTIRIVEGQSEYETLKLNRLRLTPK